MPGKIGTTATIRPYIYENFENFVKVFKNVPADFFFACVDSNRHTASTPLKYSRNANLTFFYFHKIRVEPAQPDVFV